MPQASSSAPRIRELHGAEKALNRRSVEELIRLLRSGRVSAVTAEHLRALGEYCPIDVAGERYFAGAFSTGKEVAWSLALALELGPGAVLQDLLALRASMLGARESDEKAG
jgi:hypothetical protein